MKMMVVAHTRSKHPRIEKDTAGLYHVYIIEAAKEGKANRAIIKAIAEYLDVPKSSVSISKGLKGKKKVVEIA